MKFLLDTHVLLWWLSDDPSLTSNHRRIIMDQRNSCFVSAATIWEISIKTGLGKLVVADEYLETIRSQGFLELAVSWEHANAIKRLPEHHKDPFDRILIAQAQCERMDLLSIDEDIKKYDVTVV